MFVRQTSQGRRFGILDVVIAESEKYWTIVARCLFFECGGTARQWCGSGIDGSRHGHLYRTGSWHSMVLSNRNYRLSFPHVECQNQKQSRILLASHKTKIKMGGPVHRSIWLVVVLSLFTCSFCSIAPHPFIPSLSYRTCLIRVRGGGEDVDDEFHDAVQEVEDNPTKKKKKKSKRGNSSASSSISKVNAVRGSEEKNLILSIVGGALQLVWKVLAAVASLLACGLSPAGSPSSVSSRTSSKSAALYDDLVQSLGIPEKIKKKILTGSFRKARATAARRAKFLIALSSTDLDAIQSVATLPASLRKSFVVWVGPPDPPRVPAARLVVLADRAVIASTVPSKNAKSTAAWLQDVRDRSEQTLERLATAVREKTWAKERTTGYATSIEQDLKREKKAAARQAEIAAEMQRKAAHQEMILERRKVLLAQLPEEPSSGGITVALRWTDGTKGQRRFASDGTTMGTLFDWVDAVYGIERERVQLQTLTGSHRLRFESDRETLLATMKKDMIAFRITEIEPVEEESEVEKAEEEF